MRELINISSIDGRYAQDIASLKDYFSEYALCKYRIIIEIEYLKKLTKTKKNLEIIIKRFDIKEAERIKEIEEKIHHDVKAIEYYLREKFHEFSFQELSPFIHLGLTSEDTNNLAYAQVFKDFNHQILIGELQNLLKTLFTISQDNKKVVMLGRTHGQYAVPTTFGKEIYNFYHRLEKQFKKIKAFKFEGKLNGAVGNNNALKFIYPKTNWLKFSKELINNLDLKPNFYTTQILPYDNLLEYFQIISLINGILLNLSQDMWMYIMLGVLKQKHNKDQVGSSTMPQKINPINFENCEGNLQVANGYFELYQRKFIVSRLQRDLSDSTVKRTFGTAFGHTLIAWKNLVKGLNKISVNHELINDELNNHWEVLAEPLQVYLRSVGDEKGYEKVKELLQGKVLQGGDYLKILKKLGLDKSEKFINLSPEKYL